MYAPTAKPNFKFKVQKYQVGTLEGKWVQVESIKWMFK